MKIKKGDKVRVVAGKEKGKESEVLSVNTKAKAVLLKGINIVTKHIKPGKGSKEGGIQKLEKAVDMSNVALIDKNGKTSRAGYKLEDGKKVRFLKSTKELLK